ncbi:hypothetical protein AVEN_259351-1 [Araneus ventricosus]|uniref:Uncharacterized protein n=1 Tax=Araneus ventricosus TaxID=182803 RepID=A0A4Y2DUV0_ARAVE|nr:hypothetical protein AVEN_259351-1 [Araneus ventricosus]
MKAGGRGRKSSWRVEISSKHTEIMIVTQMQLCRRLAGFLENLAAVFAQEECLTGFRKIFETFSFLIEGRKMSQMILSSEIQIKRLFKFDSMEDPSMERMALCTRSTNSRGMDLSERIIR